MWFTSKAKFVERLRVKLRAPIGGIAFGYNPLLFWLPKRGPQLIGVGRGIDVYGGEEVSMLKEELKASFDETFRCARLEWNEVIKENPYLREIKEDEWDLQVK